MPRKLPPFTTSLKDMPEEIFLHILMHGDYATFVNVSKTCRDYHEITTDPEQTGHIVEFLVNGINPLRPIYDAFMAEMREKESRELIEYAHTLPSKAAQMKFWHRRAKHLSFRNTHMIEILHAFEDLKRDVDRVQTHYVIPGATDPFLATPVNQALHALINQVIVEKETRPGRSWDTTGFYDSVPEQKLTTAYINADTQQLQELLAQLKDIRKALDKTKLSSPTPVYFHPGYVRDIRAAIVRTIKAVEYRLPKPPSRPGCSVM